MPSVKKMCNKKDFVTNVDLQAGKKKKVSKRTVFPIDTAIILNTFSP